MKIIFIFLGTTLHLVYTFYTPDGQKIELSLLFRIKEKFLFYSEYSKLSELFQIVYCL